MPESTEVGITQMASEPPLQCTTETAIAIAYQPWFPQFWILIELRISKPKVVPKQVVFKLCHQLELPEARRKPTLALPLVSLRMKL